MCSMLLIMHGRRGAARGFPYPKLPLWCAIPERWLAPPHSWKKSAITDAMSSIVRTPAARLGDAGDGVDDHRGGRAVAVHAVFDLHLHVGHAAHDRSNAARPCSNATHPVQQCCTSVQQRHSPRAATPLTPCSNAARPCSNATHPVQQCYMPVQQRHSPRAATPLTPCSNAARPCSNAFAKGRGLVFPFSSAGCAGWGGSRRRGCSSSRAASPAPRCDRRGSRENLRAQNAQLKPAAYRSKGSKSDSSERSRRVASARNAVRGVNRTRTPAPAWALVRS